MILFFMFFFAVTITHGFPQLWNQPQMGLNFMRTKHIKNGLNISDLDFLRYAFPVASHFPPPSTEGHRLAGPAPSPPATSQGPCGPGRLRAHCGARDPGTQGPRGCMAARHQRSFFGIVMTCKKNVSKKGIEAENWELEIQMFETWHAFRVSLPGEMSRRFRGQPGNKLQVRSVYKNLQMPNCICNFFSI